MTKYQIADLNSPKKSQAKLKEYDEINYFEEQTTQLEILDERELWYQYCLRIWYYLQKVFGVDILKMDTYFSIDDDGILWFTYASDIYVRFKRPGAATISIKQLAYINDEDAKHLHDVSYSNNPYLDLNRDLNEKPERVSK